MDYLTLKRHNSFKNKNNSDYSLALKRHNSFENKNSRDYMLLSCHLLLSE